MRKPIFDAIRAAARPGLFNDAGNVLALDNLLDAFGVPRDETTEAILGALSERYESGGRGPGTISAGLRDPGGVSYGIYQLASKTGTVAAFIDAEGKPWAGEFAGKAPGTQAFSAAWKAVALRVPEAFAAAQHAFIERTHYRPAVEAVREQTGLDLSTCHRAVRDAVWSCSVQHGRAAQILVAAVKSTDGALKRGTSYYDRALLERIYAERAAYVRKVAAGLPAGQRDTLLTVAAERYPDELKRAKEMMA